VFRKKGVHQRDIASVTSDPGQREREQIAQILHDQLGGLLVQLRLAYGAWRYGCSTSPQPQGPQDLGAAFDTLLAEFAATVRHLTCAFAPPVWHVDLSAALESVAAELRLRSALQVRLDSKALQAADAPEVPPHLSTLACRVVRELCLNVQKHAAASSVHIRVELTTGRLNIVVRDDGRGVLPDSVHCAAKGLGLSSARTQVGAVGGALILRSTPGAGTCALLKLPLHPVAVHG